MTRLKVRIDYTDGCADAVETWPCAFRHRDQAESWARAMTAREGATATLFSECAKHGWEELAVCRACGFTDCVEQMQERQRETGAWTCSDCAEMDAEDAAPRDCLCPGPAELGMCHCPGCAGRACA